MQRTSPFNEIWSGKCSTISGNVVWHFFLKCSVAFLFANGKIIGHEKVATKEEI
jgi:hypothetical protein